MPNIPSYSSKEKGFSHVLILIAFLVLTGVVVSNQGIKNSSLKTPQNVLGDKISQADEQSQEAAKQAAEQAQEAQKNQAEQLKESQQKTLEQQKESSKVENQVGTGSARANIQFEGQKSESEIITPEGVKIKTKVEDDGSIKVEVEGGNFKLKYSTQNGKTQLEGENAQGQHINLNTEDLNRVKDGLESELEKEGIKISTASGQQVIAKNEVAAQTNFPLSIDASTNQLTVTTPSGQKIVAVLPDQAIQNLLTSGILNRIASQSATPALTNDIGNLSNVVSLEDKNNELVYKVSGDKNYRLLGFIPVSAPSTAFVSAQSGNLVAEDQPFITNLIKLLSP